MPAASVPLGKPSPEVALACGSMSTTSTRWPACAIEAARFTVVVVLPTPPFWFAMARIRFILAPRVFYHTRPPGRLFSAEKICGAIGCALVVGCRTSTHSEELPMRGNALPKVYRSFEEFERD